MDSPPSLRYLYRFSVRYGLTRGQRSRARTKFRKIFSAGWPSRSNIERKKKGSIRPIMIRTAAAFPMAPLARK